MRKKIVAGNWKMNKNYEEALSLISEIINMKDLEINSNMEMVLAPPFPYLKAAVDLSKGYSNVFIAAQNINENISGAYTGEISAEMIQSIGCNYVIIGHSERRLYFHETNEVLRKKVDTALSRVLKIIFCIGESKEERETKDFYAILKLQLEASLFHLTENEFENIVLAYEPVWAIGTGLTASPEQAQEVHSFLRKVIAEKYSESLAESTSILYGGSCNPKNSKTLFSQKDIDGGLIGGASLKSREFLDICKSFS